MTTSKKILFISLFLLISLVFVFAVLEVGFRLFGSGHKNQFAIISNQRAYPTAGLTESRHYTFDPVAGFSLIKNMNDEAQKIHTDGNGFRVVSKPFDPNLDSIVFVGDSTVFGYTVSDQDSYIYLLSKLRGLQNFNVVNTGVPSYSVAHMVATLKEKVPGLRPKFVFVQILWPWKPFDAYSNPDAWKTIDFDFYKKTVPMREKFVPPQDKKLQSYTVNFFFDIWMKVKYAKEIKSNLTRPGVRDFDIPEAEEKKLAMDHINLFKEGQAALPQGTTVIYFVHPFQYTIFRPEYQNLGKEGKSLFVSQLNALDPTEYVRSHFTGEPLYVDSSHLTPVGNKVFCGFFAEKISDLIQKVDPNECWQ